MTNLIAKGRLPWDGRYLSPGERFEESERNALILIASGQAVRADVDSHVYSTAIAPSQWVGEENIKPTMVHEHIFPGIDEYRAHARSLGIEVDGRWGVVRIREEINRYSRRDMRAREED